jgi:hypothetical protein
MMTIRVADDLLRRADEARDFPDQHAVLKQPRDAGVLESVRRDFVTKTGEFARPSILPIGLVLSGDIVGEGLFSRSAIVCAATSADFKCFVENDPDGFTASLSFPPSAGQKQKKPRTMPGLFTYVLDRSVSGH